MKRILFLFLIFGITTAQAQVKEQPADKKSAMEKSREKEERLTDPVPKEFQFIGYSFFRTTTSNVTPTNDVLQGQVIGRLYGPNSTETVDRVAQYTEQRFVPMFIYRPGILDGFATFRGLFKIDYTWGDNSYGVGNNRGGGLSGGQVNFQTLMANVSMQPQDAWWNLVLGMQRIFDGPYDPNVNGLDHFQTTGYKLSFWGTQAVGASWFARPHQAVNARFGFFQLWENQVSRDQDVFITMADVVTLPTPKLELGFNAWYLRDTANGMGGISILGQGMTSQLAAYNGATRVIFPGNNQRYKADILWLGTNVNYNRNFVQGPLQFDAYVISNLGSIDPEADGLGNVSVFGTTVNANISYRYGKTNKDKVWMELLATTGDGDNVEDGKLNSVLTGNVWGSPVGIYSSHRSFLLFPDPQVVSRYYSMVHDISNMGLGVTGGSINFMKDIIPFKFSAKVGGAFAYSAFTLPGGGNHIGTEVNAELKYDLKVYLTLGLSAAYAVTGDFYDAPASTETRIKPDNPWVTFVTLSWLMFN
ncbi:MAG TPA: hypothetical protein DEQ34_00065 [Balneolaceae bacterium]|nr:hypothetical protein [Balneolaceae bacterium]|tara:strand:- start:143974 stop:145566 length:1593 start_codon:yes stop_codon:yes gene_type:complete